MNFFLSPSGGKVPLQLGVIKS